MVRQHKTSKLAHSVMQFLSMRHVEVSYKEQVASKLLCKEHEINIITVDDKGVF